MQAICITGDPHCHKRKNMNDAFDGNYQSRNT
jgi:hypothetical protein